MIDRKSPCLTPNLYQPRKTKSRRKGVWGIYIKRKQQNVTEMNSLGSLPLGAKRSNAKKKKKIKIKKKK
jgi:hypothetical protein